MTPAGGGGGSRTVKDPPGIGDVTNDGWLCVYSRRHGARNIIIEVRRSKHLGDEWHVQEVGPRGGRYAVPLASASVKINFLRTAQRLIKAGLGNYDEELETFREWNAG